jgi:nicotinate dehydrogenase subunit B
VSGPAAVISRRAVLAGTGTLIFSFASAAVPRAEESAQRQNRPTPKPQTPALPGSLKEAPYLDSWIRIDANGAITVFTGKAELGQGIKTALLQIAAEQLGVEINQLKLVTADTRLTPNEGYTAGSHSLQDSGTAIMNAAAQVRQVLIGEAARRAGVSPQQMKTENGAVPQRRG